MFETVSVDDALKRGKNTVNLPILLIIVFAIVASFCSVTVWRLSGWLIVISIVSGFVVAWLYWAKAIVKWRLWAFDNVRNVHELRRRAIKENLIWADGSFFNKTEIWSADQRAQWAALQYKFEQPDIFVDDLSVPVVTQILYSRPKAVVLMLGGLGMFLLAYLSFFKSNNVNFWGFAFIAVGIYLMVLAGLGFFDRRPQITLSNEGIATKDIKFYSWADIYGEDVKVENKGRTSTTYLVYYGGKKEYKTSIGQLDVGKSKLEKLLRVYRGRFEQGGGKRVNHRSTVV